MRNPTGKALDGLREAPRPLYEAPLLRAIVPGVWEKLFQLVTSCLVNKRAVMPVRELRYKNVYQWSKHWDPEPELPRFPPGFWDGG